MYSICVELITVPCRCWSNYLGRQPQFPLSNVTAHKFDVFPDEDSEMWSPYTDSGLVQANTQPSRTRAIALQTSLLCEISNDLLMSFYHPNVLDKPLSKQAELKKLSELHTRLEAWRKNLPKEIEPKEGQLPNVLLMQYVPRNYIFRFFLSADLHAACSSSFSLSISIALSLNIPVRRPPSRLMCRRGSCVPRPPVRSQSYFVCINGRMVSAKFVILQFILRTRLAQSIC